jgi:hypothetical protein
VLIFFAIYVLSSAKLQISPHYGVEGKGALVGGYICLGIGLLVQALLLVSGVSFFVAVMCSTAAIFVVVPLTLVAVVHFYGNDFAIPDRQSRSPRSKRYYIPGLMLVSVYLAAIGISALVAVARGDAGQAWLYAFSAAFLGALPGVLGLWLLVRASALYEG